MTQTLDSQWWSALLEASPLGIILFEESGRVRWANARMSDFTGLSVEELCSLDRETAAKHRLESLFEKPEKLQLPVIGRHAVSCLECHYERLSGPDGSQLDAAFYTDKTEQCMLEARIERLILSDELTGTLNRRGLIRDLETLVSRSRRYNNALSVMLLEFDTADAGLSDAFILEASRCLRDQVRWADIIGRFSDNSFLLLLPETDSEATQGLAEKIFEQVDTLQAPEGMDAVPAVYCGLSQWQRGNDVNMLLERVSLALAMAREDGSRQFVAA